MSASGPREVDKRAAPTDTRATDTTCAADPSTAAHTALVVTAAQSLLAALTPAQREAVHDDKTLANAERWSNFPATVIARNGVRLGDLDAAARAAADALVAAAAGPNGARLFAEIRRADDAYAPMSRNPKLFGADEYYISIHGTASPSASWMLQVAGHHVAYNFTYNGRCTSATPLFDGIQPSTWKDADGQHAPLEGQRASLASLLSMVSALPGARLAGTFDDMVNGPAPRAPGGGGTDTKYPSLIAYPTGTTGRGVRVGTLSRDQQALVKSVIGAWVNNVAAPVANALVAAYESDDALAQTYVAYSGAPDLSTTSSYGRIDGPRVWIEFTVQEGVTDNAHGQGHFHTIWRDKAADYGGDYVSP